jgi:hypothetical protein
MAIVNKCNSSVSASSCSPDPTIKSHPLPPVEQNNVTVVTSIVTRSLRGIITHTSIAAVAHHLWGNLSPQYLNAIMSATNHAIADTGAMSFFIMDGVDVDNKCITTKLLTINLLDGTKVMLAHVCNIHILGLPTVLTRHIIPSLTTASLIGICPLCKAR